MTASAYDVCALPRPAAEAIGLARMARLMPDAKSVSGKYRCRRKACSRQLTGEDVILAHRLLKNSVSKPEYILMSASFHRLAGDLAGYQSEKGEETYDDLGRIDTVVFSQALTTAD